MKKKNIDKKVALSIGGISVLCLGLLFGAWYLNHEPEESFTPAAQEVETLAETWDDKLDSSIPEASIKEESLYTGEISDNTQTVISEDENGSNVDLSGSVTKEEAQETKPTEKPEPIGILFTCPGTTVKHSGLNTSAPASLACALSGLLPPKSIS